MATTSKTPLWLELKKEYIDDNFAALQTYLKNSTNKDDTFYKTTIDYCIKPDFSHLCFVPALVDILHHIIRTPILLRVTNVNPRAIQRETDDFATSSN